jgi:general stress protein 26
MNATAQRILDDVHYATLSTADSAGNPWNTPVFYAYDDQGCIYWSSLPTSVHSQNIANNSKAFIVIYNSKSDEGLGLYIDTTVVMLGDMTEIKQALTRLGERRGKPFEHPEKFTGNGPQRIYKATPMACWTNSADKDADGDFIKDYRVGININDA